MFMGQETFNELKTMRENLKLLRKRNKWSVEQLSQIAEINVKTLKGIEGDEDFEVEYLFTLCDVYGIKVHEIFLTTPAG